MVCLFTVVFVYLWLFGLFTCCMFCCLFVWFNSVRFARWFLLALLVVGCCFIYLVFVVLDCSLLIISVVCCFVVFVIWFLRLNWVILVPCVELFCIVVYLLCVVLWFVCWFYCCLFDVEVVCFFVIWVCLFTCLTVGDAVSLENLVLEFWNVRYWLVLIM